MWIAEIAGLVGRETPAELFVRVVRSVLVLDKIEDEPVVGDCAHSALRISNHYTAIHGYHLGKTGESFRVVEKPAKLSRRARWLVGLRLACCPD